MTNRVVSNVQANSECIDAILEDDLVRFRLWWKGVDSGYYLVCAFNSLAWKIAAWMIRTHPLCVNRPLTGKGPRTPIMYCVNNDRAVATLLENGADLTAKDSYGQMLLHYFARDPRLNVIPLLERGADERGRMMLHVKYESGWWSVSDLARVSLHPQWPVLENFRKLMVLVHARETKEITLLTELIRLLRPFLYNV